MTRPPPKVLYRTSRELRALAMECEEGKLIGCEDDLLVRLRVSRPTLRQASVLVIQEQLIKTRPGPKGGYFAARPKSSSVAHMAGIYFQAHDAAPYEIVQVIEPICIVVARKVARDRDERGIKHLRASLRDEYDLGERSSNEQDFLAAEERFNMLLQQISRNRVLALITEILTELATIANGGAGLWCRNSKQVIRYRRLRNRVVEAIIDGDEDIAGLAAQRCSSYLIKWLIEGIGQGNGKAATGLRTTSTDDARNIAEP